METAIAAVTFGLALLGAVLGVLNTWRAFDRDRPKIRVVPKYARPVNGADPRIGFCIDVLNLSAFPLTITEVGVLYHGTAERGAVVVPIIIDGGKWPRRLEPRTSVTAYLQRQVLEERPHRIRCAYARTDCGRTFKGNSPALRDVVKKLPLPGPSD